MKQKHIKKGMTLLALLLSSFVFSQTVTQVQEIKTKTNVEKLKTLEKKFQLEQSRNKQRALTLAQINGWPITYTGQNGSFHELVSVTENGNPIYNSTFDLGAARSTRTDWLHNGGGLGLNVEGQGMTAHVWDGGIARTTHQEYDGPGGENRFTVGDGSGSRNFHAAHVTGTIISSGVQASAKGMAPQARGIGYDWNNDLTEATGAAMNGMLLSNHSYGTNAENVSQDWLFGAYIEISRDWDELMYNAPYYLMVLAAGNDGNDNTSNSQPNQGAATYDKLTRRQTSKNSMVVANGQDASIDSDGNLISVVRNSGSSEGPTDDLRIKPDIMGNGTGLNSSHHDADNAYNILSGTSMASPNVTGSLLLLQQHYNEVNGTFMRAATLKGLALHTTDEVGTVGPDAQHGWGLMNTKRAAETINSNGLQTWISEEILSEGETYTMTVKSDGTNPLMASISWTDLPGQVASGTANDGTPVLVNDLDIRITQNTDIFEPWRLTSVSTADKGDNLVDPYERVDVDGASGEYTITVTHKGTLADGPQRFSLIITGVDSNFTFVTAESSKTVCSNTDAVFDFDYTQVASGTTNFSVQNLPAGLTADFSSSSITATGLLSLTIGGLENVSAGTYEMAIVGNDGSETETRNVSLTVYHPNFDNDPMSISYPSNGQRGILFPGVTLSWNENKNAESYDIEVSDNPSFTNIIASGTETDLDITISGLTINSVYYWRIKPSNQCATGDFSEIYSFQTAGSEDCSNTYSATNFSNAQIFLNSDNTASVPIDIADDLTISRLIVDVDITHSSVEDLTLFIQEPSGLGSNNIILAQNVCDDNDNITNVTFDDTGSPLVCNPGDPAITGTIIPAESLGFSSGKSSSGRWFFAARDTEFLEGGDIDAASITVCTAVENSSLPSFTNNLVDVAANGIDIIQTTDIEASTASETAAQQVYTLVTLPVNGTVRKNDVILAVGDTFTQEDVDLGNITYANTQTSLFTDSFKVDITNGVNGWLPSQEVNLSASVVSAPTFELLNLSLYPNPTSGIISVRFESQTDKDVNVEIYDLQGRSIYKKSFSSNSSLFDESMNVGRVANGIYLIKINQGDRSTTKRVIISK